MTSTSRTSTTRKAVLGAAALSVMATGMWTATSPAAAAATLDQEDYTLITQTMADIGTSIAANRGPYAQTFTAGVTGALTSVTLPLQKQGTGAGATASIYTTSGGIPVCALATEPIDMSAAPTATITIPMNTVSISFTSPAQVEAGTQYAIVVSSTDRGANSIWWSGKTTDVYSAGAGLQSVSGTWGSVQGSPGTDWGFETYADSGLTGNSVCGGSGGGSDVIDNTIWYQSYGRLSAAEECASGYTGSWAEWAHGNTGGYVCNRAVYSYHPEDDATNVFFGTWRTS